MRSVGGGIININYLADNGITEHDLRIVTRAVNGAEDGTSVVLILKFYRPCYGMNRWSSCRWWSENMHKSLIFAVMVLPFIDNANASSIKPESGKYGYDVCGFHFKKFSHLSLTKHVIAEDSLRNRTDNDRFNACRYKVFVSYFNIPFELGFGENVTTEAVRRWSEFADIYTGLFRYDGNQWEGPSDKRNIQPYKIFVRNTSTGIVISGLFTRKSNPSKVPDYCFGMSAIGKKRFLTAWVCHPKKQELIPLEELFRKNVVISFNQS